MKAEDPDFFSIFKPLYTNGFFLLVLYNKHGIAHCTLSADLFISTKSVDPDEMQHCTAFHLGLHCLQNYSFRGFLNTNG